MAAIRNQVRGLIPWPCATAELAGQRFKIYKTAVGTATDKTPGTLLSDICQDTTIYVENVTIHCIIMKIMHT